MSQDTPEVVQIEEQTSNEVKTQVTSIAEEEAKTGQKVNVPNAEELVARANVSFIQNLQMLSQLINMRQGTGYRISRKGMNRLILSILNLPMDDQHVTLQGEAEKAGFGIGQRIVADRFLLTQHHIGEEIKRRREMAAAEAAANVVETKEEIKVETSPEGGNDEQK